MQRKQLELCELLLFLEGERERRLEKGMERGTRRRAEETEFEKCDRKGLLQSLSSVESLEKRGGSRG